ncbi:MAG: CBS domain-containing protein [Fidelibacterota bacterium]|nr:MAG: CBS domain-containing protein [Candidatus Neomarinimicrobiota bacterium]
MTDNLTSLRIQELAYELRIADAMSTEVISVESDATIMNVRETLRDKRISGLPVVDNHKLVGIISIENLLQSVITSGIEGRVKDSMVSEVVSVNSDEPLIYAVRKFDQFGYGRFPVVKRDSGELVGIITKGDIVKCLLRKLEVNFHEEEIEKYRASHIFEDIHSDHTTLTFQYKIKGGEYKSAGKQSGNLKVNLLRLGITPTIVRRIAIASCEAEMNIIIFTDGGELIVAVEEDKIKVNAIDEGPGIADVEKAMHEGYSTAPDWVRELGFGAGMGLPNIKNCSDEMSIDTKLGKGTNLEFIVNTRT